MERWAFYARRFALTFGQRTANGAEIEHALTKGKKQVRGLVSGTVFAIGWSVFTL